MHSGHETDGKFGPFLFESNYFEINFDKNLLNLYPALPGVVKDYKAIPLIEENGYYFIEASIKIDNELISNRYLVHSGYSSTILFDDELPSKIN